MSDYWSNYWKQGHLTSFGQDIKGNYVGRLAKSWLSFFTSLEQQPLTLVDIGTGNGALLELATRVPQSAHWNMIGVDAASLTIPDSLQLPNVDFKENTPAESLPFDDQSVDVVISQFGIEYANVAKALSEVRRVLKPGGIFKAIMHDSESCIVKPNAIILAAAKILQSDGYVLHNLRELIDAVANFDIQSNEVASAKHNLDISLKDFMQKGQAGMKGTNFPAFLNAIMHPKYSYAERVSMMELFTGELEGQVSRLTELCNAASDVDKKQDIELLLQQLGMKQISTSSVIEEDGRLLGWQVSATNG